MSSSVAVEEVVVFPTTLELLLLVELVLDLAVAHLQIMNLIMSLLVVMVVTALMMAAEVEVPVAVIVPREVVVVQDVIELLQVEEEKVVALDIVPI